MIDPIYHSLNLSTVTWVLTGISAPMPADNASPAVSVIVLAMKKH